MARILHVKDLQDLSAAERKLLFFFAIFPGNHTAADFLAFALSGARSSLPSTMVSGLLNGMVAAEILEPGGVSRGVVGPGYRLAAKFTVRSLQRLGHEAFVNGWWPSVEVFQRNTDLACPWLGAELASGVRNFVDPLQVWQVVETLKALVVGGDCQIGGVPSKCRYPLESVYWTAVSWWLELQAPLETLQVADLPPKVAVQLYPVLLEQGFLRGCDLRQLLDGARKAMVSASAGAWKSTSALCRYCALAVWTGRRDLLNGVAGLVASGSPAEKFAAICLDVFDGRFEEAEKAFASLSDNFRGALPTEVASPVWLLGVVLTLRQGTAMTRVVKYSDEMKREPTETLNWHPVGRFAFAEVVKRRGDLVRHLVDAEGCGDCPSMAAVRADGDPLESAKNWFRAGYPTMALLALAEVGRYDSELLGMDAFAKGLVANGAVPLVKALVCEPKWKLALRELEERLPVNGGTVHAEQPLPGKIGWELQLEPISSKESDADFFVCTGVHPFYRGPRASEDGGNDRAVTVKALSAVRYRACLTDCDVEVLRELSPVGGGAGIGSLSTLDKVLGLLCGHPRLKGGTMGPLTLTRSPCELRTAKTADGGMVLSLPDWLCRSVKCSSLLRREDAGRFLLHPITKRVREVVEVFLRYGQDGRVEVPTEGVESAKRMLLRLVGDMSVGGDFAESIGGAVRKLAGDPTPHVRLDYANETLTLRLVVEPITHRSSSAEEPGMGLREQLVALRGGRAVLLRRDLAAEETSAEAVRTALAPFDKWATARNRWRIADASDSLEALRALRELNNVKLDWPEGEKLRVAKAKASRLAFELSGEDWFGVDGEVELDDGRVLKLIQLLHALSEREGNYVRFGDHEYLFLSNELRRRLEALSAATGAGTSGSEEGRLGFPGAALPMLSRVFEDDDDGGDLPPLPEVLKERAAAIRSAFEAEVEVPPRFQGELRSYQVQGYTWMARLAACGFGACLADDMGLGKTVQVIALLLARAAVGPSLVVAPASVCHNWALELKRFAPTLKVVEPGDEKGLPELKRGEVVVASYGLLVARAETFESVAWNGVVLDEAQAVKNSDTQRAQIVRRLRSKFRVAATGTPVENRLAEFASIFAFLNPGLLGPQRDFQERFVSEDGLASPLLKELVKPFVLRRLKREVLKELPDKTEVVLRVTLDESERAQYEACRVDALKGLEEKGETRNRISVLAALMRLRRCCCHPSLVFPEATRGAKLESVMELLGELRDAGHRVLVFSQFVDFLTIVRGAVEDRGWSCRYLDGSTPKAERAAEVDAFQRGDGDFFLISLKAGGMGLNLTAANYVVLLDPWWNPAVEDQAADRAHRIGQKLPVTVYRMVVEGTVEEKMLAMHASKRFMSQDLLENAVGEKLSTEALLELFK